jgi:hypothetical protein
MPDLLCKYSKNLTLEMKIMGIYYYKSEGSIFSADPIQKRIWM